MSLLQSSNPVLGNAADSFDAFYGSPARSDTATIAGIINKTGVLVLIAVAAGVGGYALNERFPPLLFISAIASFIICLGVGFVLRGKPQLAPIVAPIYAAVEGVFLGGFTGIADRILDAKGIAAAGGVGLQAMIITIAALAGMLLLYRAGIIKPTAGFKRFMGVAVAGIMIAYLLNFLLMIVGSLFGTSFRLPLLSVGSAVNDHGLMGFLGLGINLLILGIASLTLVLDFEQCEKVAAAGQPKYMEWFCGFGLIVSLAWIYYEAVKLVIRLSVLFSGRD